MASPEEMGWIKINGYDLGPCPKCHAENNANAYQTEYYIYVLCHECGHLVGPVIFTEEVVSSWRRSAEPDLATKKDATMATHTIEETRQAKQQLLDDITRLVLKFTEEYGVAVEAIDIRRETDYAGKHLGYTAIEIDVRL